MNLQPKSERIFHIKVKPNLSPLPAKLFLSGDWEIGMLAKLHIHPYWSVLSYGTCKCVVPDSFHSYSRRNSFVFFPIQFVYLANVSDVFIRPLELTPYPPITRHPFLLALLP